jgi:hypothetical protein
MSLKVGSDYSWSVIKSKLRACRTTDVIFSHVRDLCQGLLGVYELGGVVKNRSSVGSESQYANNDVNNEYRIPNPVQLVLVFNRFDDYFIFRRQDGGAEEKKCSDEGQR